MRNEKRLVLVTKKGAVALLYLKLDGDGGRAEHQSIKGRTRDGVVTLLRARLSAVGAGGHIADDIAGVPLFRVPSLLHSSK